MNHPSGDDWPGVAAVRAELAALPAPTAPPGVRARWSAAVLATDRSARAPRKPSALIAAAVAATVLFSGGVLAGGGLTAGGLPGSPLPARLPLSSAMLADAAAAGLAGHDLGSFGTAERLDRCLAAAGIPSTTPLGARDVVLDGRPGVLLVLPAAADRVRLLVVDPGCGAAEAPANPVLGETTVTR